jgi:hypothetical protein
VQQKISNRGGVGVGREAVMNQVAMDYGAMN